MGAFTLYACELKGAPSSAAGTSASAAERHVRDIMGEAHHAGVRAPTRLNEAARPLPPSPSSHATLHPRPPSLLSLLLLTHPTNPLPSLPHAGPVSIAEAWDAEATMTFGADLPEGDEDAAEPMQVERGGCRMVSYYNVV